MNPENGWGNYDELLVLLDRMTAATAEHPDAIWSVWG